MIVQSVRDLHLRSAECLSSNLNFQVHGDHFVWEGKDVRDQQIENLKVWIFENEVFMQIFFPETSGENILVARSVVGDSVSRRRFLVQT